MGLAVLLQILAAASVTTAASFRTRQVLASPDIPVTSFSCEGRPIGYYADVETNCKVYHMCGGSGGLQYSYQCPNTTLFHQRMLICAHWYQVNCSRSEQDYSANLLIGQKDSLFVDQPYSLKEVFGLEDSDALQKLNYKKKEAYEKEGTVIKSYGQVFRDLVRNDLSAAQSASVIPRRGFNSVTTQPTVSKLRPTNVSFRSTIETPFSDYSTANTLPMVPRSPSTEPVTAVEPPALELLPPFSDQAEETNTVELHLKDHRRSFFIPETESQLPKEETIVVTIPVRRHSRFKPTSFNNNPIPQCSRCHPMFIIDKDNCSPCLLIR